MQREDKEKKLFNKSKKTINQQKTMKLKKTTKNSSINKQRSNIMERQIINKKPNKQQNIHKHYQKDLIFKNHENDRHDRMMKEQQKKAAKVIRSTAIASKQQKLTTNKDINMNKKISTDQNANVGLKSKNSQLKANTKDQANHDAFIQQAQTVIGQVTIRKESFLKVKEYLTARKIYLLSKQNWYCEKDKFLSTPMNWEFLIPCIKQAKCQLLHINGNPIENFPSFLCLPTYSNLKILLISQSFISSIEFLPFMNLQQLQSIGIENTCAHIFKSFNKTNWPNLKYLNLVGAYISQLQINRMRMNPIVETLKIETKIIQQHAILQFWKTQMKMIGQFQAIKDNPIQRLENNLNQ